MAVIGPEEWIDAPASEYGTPQEIEAFLRELVAERCGAFRAHSVE